jgi:hypothetical protein
MPGCRWPTASFTRNHQVAEDFPTSVSLSLPHSQIFLEQTFLAIELCLRLPPFVDKVPVLSRSPRLYRGRPSSPEACKLSCHVPLNLSPTCDAFTRRTAVNGVLGIRRNDSCDVAGLYSVDPGLIPGIDPSSRSVRQRSGLRHSGYRDQATNGNRRYEQFHSYNSTLQDVVSPRTRSCMGLLTARSV